MTAQPLNLIKRLLSQRVADVDAWLPLDYAAALTEMQAALGVTSAAMAIKCLRSIIEEDSSLELSMDKSHVRAVEPLTEQTSGKRRLPLPAAESDDRDDVPPSRRMRHGSESHADMGVSDSVGANGVEESSDEADADEDEIRRGAEGFDFGVALLEAGKASGTAHADTDWLRGALAEDAEAVARGAASGAAIRGAIGSAGPRSGRRRAPVHAKPKPLPTSASAHSSSSAAAATSAAAAAASASKDMLADRGDSDSKTAGDDGGGDAEHGAAGGDHGDSGIIDVPPALASELYSAADGPPGADGSSSRARTLFLGNIPTAATAPLLMELAVQCGPVRGIRYVPDGEAGTGGGAGAGLSRDASNDAAGGGPGQGAGQGAGRGYAFVEYEHEASLHYASRALNGIPLFGQPLKAHPRNNFVSGGAAGVFMTDAGSAAAAAAAEAAAASAAAGAAAADYDAAYGGVGGGGGDGGRGRPPVIQLFVRPVPDGIDEWHLTDLATLALDVDAVAGVRIPRPTETGRSRGFAFVDYHASRAQEVADIAMPALRAGLCLGGRIVDFKVSEQSLQLPEPTSVKAGDEGAPLPILTLGDAAGSSADAGAGSGSAQTQLPVDGRMLQALRVEALTALCRSIDARLRGWPAPGATAGPSSSSSSSGYSQSPTPGPAGSPSGSGGRGYGYGYGQGYGYGSSSSSSGGYGAARTSSAAGAGGAGYPSAAQPQPQPSAMPSAVAAAVMALDAAATASTAGGSAAAAAPAAGAADRRSRWDRDVGAGAGAGAGTSSREPSRDGRGHGYNDRDSVAGSDRDRDRERSASAARAASYSGYSGSSSAYAYAHSYAPPPAAPAPPPSHYGEAPPAYGVMLPHPAAVADPSAQYGGSAAAAGPVAAALGRAWSAPPATHPMQYAAPAPAPAHAAPLSGYVLVPTGTQYVQAPPPPPSGFVLVPDPAYRPAGPYPTRTAPPQNPYGDPMDI